MQRVRASRGKTTGRLAPGYLLGAEDQQPHSISNLILNINLRVEDAGTGKMLFQRSVDMRGNTDRSWRRAAKALVDLLAEDPWATS